MTPAEQPCAINYSTNATDLKKTKQKKLKQNSTFSTVSPLFAALCLDLPYVLKGAKRKQREHIPAWGCFTSQ